MPAYIALLAAILIAIALMWGNGVGGQSAVSNSLPTRQAQPANSETAAAQQKLLDRFGIQLVHVPPGPFRMGSVADAGNDQQDTNVHEVNVPGFWIGMTEVTNTQYQFFVDEDGYLDESLWTEDGWAWRTQVDAVQPLCWQENTPRAAQEPVKCITWYEALAYSRWLARTIDAPVRLPTEAEWEKAARGTDGRIYPWGDAPPQEKHANLYGVTRDTHAITPAGHFLDGASPYGALDMAGNVWEWTHSLYQPYPYDALDGREVQGVDHDRALRGGSWLTPPQAGQSAARFKGDPDEWAASQGMRIVLEDVPQ